MEISRNLFPAHDNSAAYFAEYNQPASQAQKDYVKALLDSKRTTVLPFVRDLRAGRKSVDALNVGAARSAAEDLLNEIYC